MDKMNQLAAAWDVYICSGHSQDVALIKKIKNQLKRPLPLREQTMLCHSVELSPIKAASYSMRNT